MVPELTSIRIRNSLNSIDPKQKSTQGKRVLIFIVMGKVADISMAMAFAMIGNNHGCISGGSGVVLSFTTTVDRFVIHA